MSFIICLYLFDQLGPIHVWFFELAIKRLYNVYVPLIKTASSFSLPPVHCSGQIRANVKEAAREGGGRGAIPQSPDASPERHGARQFGL